jgi:hypothetical protein
VRHLPRIAPLLALCLAILVPTAALAAKPSQSLPAVPTFVDEAKSAGVTHTYDGGFDYYVGGGVAVFDCDGDDRPELYFAGGEQPAALFRNRSRTGKALRFDRVESGVTDLTAVTGAYPLDIDSDGTIDLVVLRHGEDRLLRGLGDCAFELANEAWGFDGGDSWTDAGLRELCRLLRRTAPRPLWHRPALASRSRRRGLRRTPGARAGPLCAVDAVQ